MYNIKKIMLIISFIGLSTMLTYGWATEYSPFDYPKEQDRFFIEVSGYAQARQSDIANVIISHIKELDLTRSELHLFREICLISIYLILYPNLYRSLSWEELVLEEIDLFLHIPNSLDECMSGEVFKTTNKKLHLEKLFEKILDLISFNFPAERKLWKEHFMCMAENLDKIVQMVIDKLRNKGIFEKIKDLKKAVKIQNDNLIRKYVQSIELLLNEFQDEVDYLIQRCMIFAKIFCIKTGIYDPNPYWELARDSRLRVGLFLLSEELKKSFK